MTAAYKVGISMMLTGNATHALADIGRHLGFIGTRVTDIEKGFGKWGTAIGGAGAIMGSEKLLHWLGGVAMKAKEVSHEIVQIEKLGTNPLQLKEIDSAAYRVARDVPGTKEVEPYKLYGAAYSMLGHDNAIKMMKPLAEFAQVIKNTAGKFSDDATTDIYKMVRAGDLMGKFIDQQTHQVDVAQLGRFLNMGSKIMAATHGYVNAQTWLGLAQQGAPALSGMSDKGLMEMGIIAQAMGGQRAGTALMSTFQQFVGGTMFKRTAEGMVKIGLMKQSEYRMDHGRVILNDDVAKRLGAQMQSPLDFLTKQVIPGMEKAGMKNIEDQKNFLFRFLGRATTQRMWHDFLRNRSQIEQERGRMEGGMGVSGSLKLANSEDLEQVGHNFSTAWENMWTTISRAGSPATIAVMNSLTGAFEGINKVASVNPDAIVQIGIGIAGLGSALLVGGIVALGVAIGPIGAAAAAAAAAIGTMVAAMAWLSNVKMPGFGPGAAGTIPLGGGVPSYNPFDNGSTTPGKQGSYIPPQPRGGSGNKFAAVYLDGRKVGSAVIGHIADRASLPVEGAPHHDATWQASPLDFALG